MNNEILGALLKNAAYIKDYDYVIDVLKYAMSENIKPSLRFAQILSIFKNHRYYSLQKQDNDEELLKYNAFYTVYKTWKSQMELTGLSADEVTKLLNVHPWKQIKEAQGVGIEGEKNIYTRRLWKRQRVLKKLNPTHIKQLTSESQMNSEKDQFTEHVVKPDSK